MNNCYATDDLPPSTPITWPVIQELSSLNKNFAIEDESLPFPILLRGCILAIPSAIFSFFNKNSEIFELVKLGAIQFTLILGANSAANEIVKPSTAPFAEATIAWLGNPCFIATVENNTTDPLFFLDCLPRL